MCNINIVTLKKLELLRTLFERLLNDIRPRKQIMDRFRTRLNKKVVNHALFILPSAFNRSDFLVLVNLLILQVAQTKKTTEQKLWSKSILDVYNSR